MRGRTKVAGVLALALIPFFAMAAPPKVVVSLAEQKLYVVDGTRVVADFTVGIGKPSTPTPVGSFAISSITENPTWTVPESIMKGPNPPHAKKIPPGPDNPLGVYFMRLDDTSYGIHGTTVPTLANGEVSAGCIRMANRDVSLLAQLVERGSPVEIIADAFLPQKPENSQVRAAIAKQAQGLLKSSKFLQQ